MNLLRAHLEGANLHENLGNGTPIAAAPDNVNASLWELFFLVGSSPALQRQSSSAHQAGNDDGASGAARTDPRCLVEINAVAVID